MRTRHDPYKWPFAIGMSLLLVVGSVWLIPARWVDAFFSPLNLQNESVKSLRKGWLTLLPPLAVVVDERPEKVDEPEPKQDEPLPRQDPDWWTRGWRIRTAEQVTVRQSPTRLDSVKVIYETLGLGQDFMTRASADSALSHQLMLLRIEDSFAFDELKPYLSALRRGWYHTDKASREADMYDEHLNTIIMVPD